MIACPHRPPCSACPRFGEEGLAPATRLTLQALAAAHGLPPPPLVAGARTGFRTRARLAIRGRKGAPKLGLFREGTHEVVTVPGCVVHHPLVNEAAGIVRGALADAAVPPWSDAAQAGVARYLQISVERRTRTVQVVLVANVADPAPLAPCLDMIRDRLEHRLHSLWLNVRTGGGNAILGPTFTRWCGPDATVESFGGADVFYPPGAFGQSNLDVAERIIAQLRAWIPPRATVAEFHAGTGAIGLSLLPGVGSLRLNEVAPASLEGLAMGVERLPPQQRARTSIVRGTAGDARAMADGADVVIVDPPRKGLDASLRAHLAASPPAQLLYVSCGLSSLAADVAALTAHRSLRLVDLIAFDQMPYTDHVETLAAFAAA